MQDGDHCKLAFAARICQGPRVSRDETGAPSLGRVFGLRDRVSGPLLQEPEPSSASSPESWGKAKGRWDKDSNSW